MEVKAFSLGVGTGGEDSHHMAGMPTFHLLLRGKFPSDIFPLKQMRQKQVELRDTSEACVALQRGLQCCLSLGKGKIHYFSHQIFLSIGV